MIVEFFEPSNIIRTCRATERNTGSLFNGLPLSRPPREYEDHPMWCVLFGRAAVDVMPTSAASMQFSAKRQHKGYNVHFGMNKTSAGGADLLAQASRFGMDYETIPGRLLRGTDHFIDNFMHWYNRMNNALEFRPRETPWDWSNSTCVLSRSPKGWTLKRKGNTIPGANRRTATTIAELMAMASSCRWLHRMYNQLLYECNAKRHGSPELYSICQYEEQKFSVGALNIAMNAQATFEGTSI